MCPFCKGLFGKKEMVSYAFLVYRKFVFYIAFYMDRSIMVCVEQEEVMRILEIEMSYMTLKLVRKVLSLVVVTDERFTVEEMLMCKDLIELFDDALESDGNFHREVIRSVK